MMIRDALIAAVLCTAASGVVHAQDPWSDMAAIESEMARQLWISDTVIGYHDLANHIMIAQGQLAAGDADAHLKALGRWFWQNEGGEAQLADARNRLGSSIAGYLDAVWRGAAASTGWPGGAGQQAGAQALLQEINGAYPRFLQQNLDPAPLVMQIALIAGWARGEATVGNPFAYHLERIREAYPDPRTRARIAAASGPLTALDGTAVGATPAAPPMTATFAQPTTQQPTVQQPPRGGDFFDDLRGNVRGGGGLEYNIDRPGLDLTSFDLPSPDPFMCMAACQGYNGCAAFTYVNPGVQSSAARCWLKSDVPAAVPSTCCVSGTP